MSVSPEFNVRVLPNDIIGQAAINLAPYSWSDPLDIPSLGIKTTRLDPNNPDGEDYPDNAGGEVTNTYSLSRSWIWGSKAPFDPVTRCPIWVASPHGFDEFGGYFNAYITLLSRYNPVSNQFTVYEAPLQIGASYPHTVGHSFDNCCIVDRVLYKFTLPLWRQGDGYLQPQIAKIDLDALTDDVTSGREGAAYLGEIPPPFIPPDLTAGALDYLPGANCLVSLHKSRIDFYDLTAGAWITPHVDLGFNVANAFHNVGHYQPTAGVFVGGGGAYAGGGVDSPRRNSQWVKVNGTTRVVTPIDSSPVTMSVSETDVGGEEVKVAATFDPNSTESIFFQDNGTIYGLDTTRPTGQHWREIGANTHFADIVCAMPAYGCIGVFKSAADGNATFRLYRAA